MVVRMMFNSRAWPHDPLSDAISEAVRAQMEVIYADREERCARALDLTPPDYWHRVQQIVGPVRLTDPTDDWALACDVSDLVRP